MSPTDKGSTPESPETPEPNGEPTPGDAAPVEPVIDAPATEPTGESAPETESSGVDLTKPAESPAEESTPTYGEAPLAAAPVGSDYPAPESFASSTAAPRNNKMVIAIIAGVVVLIAAVGIPLFMLFTGGDDDSPEAQIKQVTQEYVDVLNTGAATKLPGLLCKKLADSAPADLKDGEPQQLQAKIDEFNEIKIDGDTATATFTVSAEGDESVPTESIPMQYVNEDGWKLCPQS